MKRFDSKILIVDGVISYVLIVATVVPATDSALLFCIFSDAIVNTHCPQSEPQASSLFIHFLYSTIHVPRSYLLDSSKLSFKALRTAELADARAAFASDVFCSILFPSPLQSETI